MSDQRSPARPWFDLVMEQAAVRGWSMHELARQSGVGRPTIYRWRDGTETPQARPVGLVADALGIPRERAVRLAGIIAAPPVPREITESVLRAPGLTDDDRARVLEAIARTLAGVPHPPTGPGAAGESPAGRQEAG